MNETQEICELWYEVIKTQAILETIMKKQPVCLSHKELEECETRAVQVIQGRFPMLGCKRK